jgi:hypothetical protein
MRSITPTNLLASCLVLVTSSSVWQCAQPRIAAFCSAVPGMLASHSALVSCAATSLAFASFRWAVAGLSLPTVADTGSSS